MNNEQILKQAIEKAVKNGFTWDKIWSFEYPDYYALIFSHSFAKAFWGEETITYFEDSPKCWQYHLQQMVLEEEPLKYIEKFLEEE